MIDKIGYDIHKSLPTSAGHEKNIVDDCKSIKMIEIINKTITPAEFEEKWKEFPCFELASWVPISSSIFSGTPLQIAIEKNNLILAGYFAKKEPKLVNVQRLSSVLGLISCSPIFTLFLTKKNHNLTNKQLLNLEQLDFLEILARLGSDVNAESYRLSPLDYSCLNRDLECTKLLINYGAKRKYRFNPENNELIRNDDFSGVTLETYRLAKRLLRRDYENSFHFFLASKTLSSFVNMLPKDILTEIYSISLPRLPRHSPYSLELARIKQTLKEK